MSMTLKEAFRYQNFLTELIDNVSIYLADSDNTTIVTEEHMKSKAVAGVEDEVKDNLSKRRLNVKPDNAIKFLIRLCEEKEILSKAISQAKNQHCPDMDSSIMVNQTRNRILTSLKHVAKLKNNEKVFTGSAYTMNAEGNQTKYYYDVKQTTRIDFNRPELKRIISDLSSEKDRASTTIDYWMSSVPVSYTPPFDINDTYEELLEEFNVVEF